MAGSEDKVYISEVMTTVSEDERGTLETKAYEELTRLNIPFERVDNDFVESMDECVEISRKLGLHEGSGFPPMANERI